MSVVSAIDIDGRASVIGDSASMDVTNEDAVFGLLRITLVGKAAAELFCDKINSASDAQVILLLSGPRPERSARSDFPKRRSVTVSTRIRRSFTIISVSKRGQDNSSNGG